MRYQKEYGGSMELNNLFSKYFIPASSDNSKVNTNLCEKCGGSCCKNMGCHISPFDLKEISVESIINLIEESNCISIDWWEGNPITEENTGERAFYLRIRNENSVIIDPSYGGKCSILTDNGCPLSFEYRPKGARELIPNINNKCCRDGYSKRQCAIDWYSYKDIMEQVYDHFHDYYEEKGDAPFEFIQFLNFIGAIVSDE